ncbi:hypothetical protein [Leptolyngbya sp. KIOST-1]|uniref:hypothetical protein n=1 Tax=Leptolyngbya sp. KIOST-1 TaxID=1229172 RepID=UPI0012E0517D|nr:hypothetical protein [Leptolyngbya sp. KIOST-1]
MARCKLLFVVFDAFFYYAEVASKTTVTSLPNSTPAIGASPVTLIKAWTTRKLTQLGHWLARAFGFGADTTQTTVGNTWTSDTLTRFGLEMSKGFGNGL